MIVLTIKTDQPEAELGLFKDRQNLCTVTWLAHRQLAETLHRKITDMLQEQGYELTDIEGIVVYQGPGSFTGLRIGITVANTLAYSLPAALVALQEEDWREEGVNELLAGRNDRLVVPEYGALPNITKPRK